MLVTRSICNKIVQIVGGSLWCGALLLPRSTHARLPYPRDVFAVLALESLSDAIAYSVLLLTEEPHLYGRSSWLL